MAELLRYCGFVMVFFTDTDSDGNPQTSLKIVRKDALATAAPKLLYLAADGSLVARPGGEQRRRRFIWPAICNELVNSVDGRDRHRSRSRFPCFWPRASSPLRRRLRTARRSSQQPDRRHVRRTAACTAGGSPMNAATVTGISTRLDLGQRSCRSI